MKIGGYRFDRVELAGALGDLGTLVPLSVALIALTGMSFTSVFLVVGVFYLLSGLFYGVPMPVQPMKSIAAVAVASPAAATLPALSAAGLLLGGFLLLLGISGLMELLSRVFTRPVVRGIQLGLGLILFLKGVTLIRRPALFLAVDSTAPALAGLPLNPLLGGAAAVLALVLLRSRRFPAALALVAGGVLTGAAFGAFGDVDPHAGPTPVRIALPGAGDLWPAFVLLVLPQIPLTIGNAILGTSDAARSFFGEGEATRRVTDRNLSIGMGIANLAAGALSAMPVCHGAGGLAAHYRFGARTGGAPLMIGGIFLALALALGDMGAALLASVPCGVLGVLLAFAGLELGMLVRDLEERADVFLALLVASVGVATMHLGIALGIGLAASLLLRLFRVDL